MRILQLQPYALNPEGGQSTPALGALIFIKASSAQTGGAFNLFEVACPPGYETPLHIHYCEDVAVYVLEGALTIYWGSEMKEAAPGSYFFQPRGTPHGFRVKGATPARILYLAFPAGLDGFIAEHGQPASDAEFMTVAARYKIEILGQLPD